MSIHRTNVSRFAGLMLGWLATVALAANPLWGQDFRMDTDVFVGKEKQPVAQTLTLFSNSVVYDFLLSDSREIVVLDQARGTFTLLDEKQQIQAVVTTQTALDHCFALKVHSQEIADSLFAEAASPKFTETTEERTENGQAISYVKLAGTKITYEVTGMRPKFPEAVFEYHKFADWCSRLNAMRVGNLPPEARMALNRAIAEKGMLPREITRTILSTERLGNKTSEVRSRHLVNWTLSTEDQKRIERAHDAMVKFTKVDFEEYRKRLIEAQATVAAK